MGLCFECKKNHPAISYERNVGGRVQTEHYCLACYEKKFISVEADGNENGRTFEACPYCDTTVEVLKTTAIVGCPHCYRTLGAVAIPMVVRMQQGQADAHRGKRSENVSAEVRYRNRKKELLALLIHYENIGDFEQVEKYKQETERLDRLFATGGYDVEIY